MMNNIQKLMIAIGAALLLWGCSEGNYPGGEISPFIGTYDVRNIYKNAAVELNESNLDGSSKLAVLVTSDHSGGNIPEHLVFVQDARRLGFLRGLALNLGSEAKDYLPGDSILVDIKGAMLDRVEGILQLSNISGSKIQRVSRGLPVAYQKVNVAQVLANPNAYESTMTVVVKGGFNPIPETGAKLAGDWQLNDGFGNLLLRTESTANFADKALYRMGNYYGLILNKVQGDSLVPYLKPRVASDIVELKSVYNIPKVIITGWSNDPRGTDANYEYMQFMATEDIDFSKTPYAVITTNNAGASTPIGYPAKGWATGGLRTYKFNLTTGVAKKGEFFYVGGTGKLIMSTGSTSIADANWITAYAYNTRDGFDGVGTKTTNLLANSGNAYGISIFQGTKIDANSVPEDVMFVGTGGTLFGNGYGYKIANNDFYDVINPITLEEQPFYRSGTNTTALTYNTPSDAGFFYILGGEFNMTLGRWTKARSKYAPILEKESKLTEIEDPNFVTKLVY
ncbi:DUF5689 domain-containing protein [Sphingobacterium psychroaquaticum]|uniref:DUF5689 domain-containing protein n=1 Tax=Sphingobacterium psychroaquaticum TaxID=561061 RepID=A0A1X7K132_9SPHI|nr:DUF5689 domain-containing protein [Sphingobacterium psychroaquaticum]SMG34559.1 hypothetical protein SAMN05660862_2408 [Sphingobacterium psychroaquaticum]